MSDAPKSSTGGNAVRPEKLHDIDPGELEELASLGCTHVEAASWFELSQAEFKALLNQPELRRIWRQGKGRGRIRLRRAQFNLAEKNATMAILLGKRYLGQRDDADNDKSGHVTVVVDTGIDRDGE